MDALATRGQLAAPIIVALPMVARAVCATVLMALIPAALIHLIVFSFVMLVSSLTVDEVLLQLLFCVLHLCDVVAVDAVVQ